MYYDERRSERQFDLADIARRLANVIRAGVVAEVDVDRVRVRVRYDRDAEGNPILSAWLPWITQRAGAARTWWAPDVGEQVVILAPGGELNQGFVLPALNQDARPAPESDPDKRVAVHEDGARFEYDREAHRYSITLPDDGEFLVTIGGTTLRMDNTLISGQATEVRWNA